MENIKPIASHRWISVILFAVGQILLWGGSYFLLPVLSVAMRTEMNWSYQFVYGSLSIALIIAGLILPKFGRLIQKNAQGEGLLLFAGWVMAIGLFILSYSNNAISFLLGWIIIGLAMGMGLYDSLFATIAQRYGRFTAKAIVLITLISSLAPTLSWYLLSKLLLQFDWRTTCQLYAVLLIIFITPLHALALHFAGDRVIKENTTVVKEEHNRTFATGIYGLLKVHFVLGSMLSTLVVVYLIEILLHNGLTMSMAVSVAAYLGISQAGSRLIEIFIPGISPIRLSYISSRLMCIAILLLLTDVHLSIYAVILFGIGNGQRSILRGTLPLFIFGSQQYASWIGRLGRWPLVMQGVVPLLGGFIVQHFGIAALLYVGLSLAISSTLVVWKIELKYKGNKENYNII